MANESKYQIDQTLLDICKDKQLKINPVIKNTTQFFMILSLSIEDDLENILNLLIDEYKDYTLLPLSNQYSEKWVKTTDEQKEHYQKISSDYRKKILNEIISIAINNSNYSNFNHNRIDVKQHEIISKNTLNFFLDREYMNDNINSMEAILMKLKNIIKKKAILSSYYINLTREIFDHYQVNKKMLGFLDNHAVCLFLQQELEKIYFIMNIKYNMKLKNKSDYLRSHKSKYEKILIDKYNDNLTKFIDSEIFFVEGLSERSEAKVFLEFYGAMLMPELKIKLYENNTELYDALFEDVDFFTLI